MAAAVGPGIDYIDSNNIRVYLPLSELKACRMCKKSSGDTKLRMCQFCAEVVYCSQECQLQDWDEHKARYCGKSRTERIDIESYWPFLALLAAVYREAVNYDTHPALNHKIINSPNPNNMYHLVFNPSGTPNAIPTQPTDGANPFTFPNGISAKPVVLGEQLIPLPGPEPEPLLVDKWWPTAASDAVGYKLQRRIAYEDGTQRQPNQLIRMMISPDSASSPHKFDDKRLTYGRSPISNFGIVQGSLIVNARDRLAYLLSDQKDFIMGQDPEDHYRIYIRTVAGSEWYLDFGLYSFNDSFVVETNSYTPPNIPERRFVPGHFHGKESGKVGGVDRLKFKPRKWFSILRDPRVHEIVRWANKEQDVANMYTLMDDIAGRTCTDRDRELLMKFLPDAVQHIYWNLSERDYLKFPKEPRGGLDLDPDEAALMDPSVVEKNEVFRHMNKWVKKVSKGKADPEHPPQLAGQG